MSARSPATSCEWPGARPEEAVIRKLAFTLLCVALLLAAARLFTGVIYASDAPVAFLVLKRAPATWVRRPEAQVRPIEQQIVLDLEEPDFSYGWMYYPLMGAVPILAPVIGGLAAVLLFVSRTPRSRLRG